MATAGRDRLLTTLAILMALLAVSNFSKPITQGLALSPVAGFVFLGERLQGMPNAIVASLFGGLLAAYACGVWTMRRWALPIALAYALWVPVNLALFTLRMPPDHGGGIFGLVYAIVAIGVSGGGAFLLWRRRDALG